MGLNKISFGLLVVALLLFQGSLQSQTLDEQPIEFDGFSKSIYFKTNPLSLLQGPIQFYTGAIKGSFEIIGSERMTYTVGGGYLYLSPVFNLLAGNTPSALGGNVKMPGYNLHGEARYYYLKFYRKKKLSKVFLPSGLYVALNASYSHATLANKTVNVQRFEVTHLNITGQAGLQLMYNDAFGMDVFAGIGYKLNEIDYFDQRGKKTSIDPLTFGFTPYYGLPIRLTMGFNLTFGLL